MRALLRQRLEWYEASLLADVRMRGMGIQVKTFRN
jgi:hypothetical protein